MTTRNDSEADGEDGGLIPELIPEPAAKSVPTPQVIPERTPESIPTPSPTLEPKPTPVAKAKPVPERTPKSVAKSGTGSGTDSDWDYPPIPDGRYFPIGRAAKLTKTPPHALRYWEEKVPALAKLVARRRGRRYYTPEAIMLLRRLRRMRRDEGRTVAGASAALSSRARKSPREWERVARELREIIASLG